MPAAPATAVSPHPATRTAPDPAADLPADLSTDLAALFGPAFRPTGPAVPVGGGFSGAGVTRVLTAAGPFALRRWPAAPPPRARLDGLHALLAHLRRADPGLPVAAPVRTLDGETLFPLRGRLAQLEPWLPGDPLPAVPSAEQAAAAGAALARFHTAAESFDPPPTARSYFAPGTGTPRSLRDRQDRLVRWLGGEDHRAAGALRDEPLSPFRDHAARLLAALAAVGPGLSRRLADAAGRPFRLFPVLRDVHREHVLMSADGSTVTGVIDPAAALADSPAADLARLAGSLEPGRLGALLAAYRAVRPLSEEEARLAGALHDAGALLSGLAWVARGLFERRPDARSPAALARLSHFAAAADRLTDHPGEPA